VYLKSLYAKSATGIREQGLIPKKYSWYKEVVPPIPETQKENTPPRGL
jgi:hypothetical protein